MKILALVLFCGFSNLAVEILAPRLLAPSYGMSPSVWAVVISVFLVGNALGYIMGGRLNPDRTRHLAASLITCAFLLLLLPDLSSILPALLPNTGILQLSCVVLICCFPIAFFYGIVPPFVAGLSFRSASEENYQKLVGNIMALGTLGSIAGALFAARIFIPLVGLEESLFILACLTACAGYMFISPQSGLLIFPLLFLTYHTLQREPDASSKKLLTHVESLTQSIRVLELPELRVRQMYFGNTLQSSMEMDQRKPILVIAQNILSAIDSDLESQEILVLGGAGHALSHAFEKRGGRVTEVELDPLVLKLSDKYFGPINGKTIIADARAFIQSETTPTYNIVVIDVFDEKIVPFHLCSYEFFNALKSRLHKSGVVHVNFVGASTGPRSDSFIAFASTLKATFPFVYVPAVSRSNTGNIHVVASLRPLSLPLHAVFSDMSVVVTDNKNPMDVLQAGHTTYLKNIS